MAKANFTNRTVWVGDNLPVMRGINSACIDLIYLDPPFNSNQDYAAPIGSIAAGAAFKDTWTLSDIDVHEHGELADRNPAAYSVIEAARNASGKSMMSYLIMMAVRLIEMERILKPTGSIYLHCDPTASHYLKLLMDSVFGGKRFRRELVWNLQTASGYKSQVKGFVRGHDTILYYTKSRDFAFNRQYLPHKPEYIRRFRKVDNDGRRYRDDRPGGRRQYLDSTRGVLLTDVWSDIMSFQQASTVAERTGYPTQKPVTLLERIIAASSNEGDIVFDPFCGCATTMVAADRLERQWAGIDLSPLALKLVNERISEDRGALWGGANVVDTLPKRTDLGVLPNYRTHRHRLYGEQEGICVGCDTHFPFKVMEVDHKLPKSRGGTDHIENLQLLCSHCNRSKGNRTMAEWRASQTV